MSQISTQTFSTNGIEYCPPSRPVVAICFDGTSDEYLNAGLARDRMPNLKKIVNQGHRLQARAAMPTFTNVNNTSIVTGVPPRVHGICGNYFLDQLSGKEVMMNSATYLKAETIFPAAARAGRKVGVVTAKEKLLDILGHRLIAEGGIAFSAEKASSAKASTHGIDGVEALVGKATPAIYSGDASVYVLEAGAALLRSGLSDFLYLSTTDFIQHKFAPEQEESLAFYEALDHQLGQFLSLGAVIGITADHGMNAKHFVDGSPNVIYLETMLEDAFEIPFGVTLPITDPYVVHHGAFGSFAVIHVPPAIPVRQVMELLMNLRGVTEVYDAKSAAIKLELPEDRMGDIIVVSGRNVVLGKSPEYHDLAALDAPLRSHGGRYEEMVPFIFSHRLSDPFFQKARGDIRNFELFSFLLNGVQGI